METAFLSGKSQLMELDWVALRDQRRSCECRFLGLIRRPFLQQQDIRR